MSDPFYGVEIIETGAGSAVVRDKKAATCLLVGTAPVGDVYANAAERAAYVNKAHIVRDRKTGVAKFGPDTAGYTIPAALDALFDQAGPKGIGTIEVINVFDPDVHVGGVGTVSNLDVIGNFSASGRATGLKKAYESYQQFGRFNKFVHAPGFNGMTGVRAELEVINNRTRARSAVDAPIGTTAQQAIAARGPAGAFDWQTNNRRIAPCWPHMRVVGPDGNERLDPYSSRFIGVWLSTIMEEGWHHSPSNRAIGGIEGSETPVLYIPGDGTSDVQLLRDAGIVSVEGRYGKGPHTSGNRSAAHPTDTDMRNLLHVQMIIDMCDEAVLHYLDQFKDRNGNAASLEFTEERLNAYLLSKTTGNDPALYGGYFRFDRTRTTAVSVAQMRFFYRLKLAPVGLQERITVDRSIDLNLISSGLGLAS